MRLGLALIAAFGLSAMLAGSASGDVIYNKRPSRFPQLQDASLSKLIANDYAVSCFVRALHRKFFIEAIISTSI